MTSPYNRNGFGKCINALLFPTISEDLRFFENYKFRRLDAFVNTLCNSCRNRISFISVMSARNTAEQFVIRKAHSIFEAQLHLDNGHPTLISMRPSLKHGFASFAD